MSENTKAFIDNLEAGNNADAGEAFKSALRDKMGDALDNKRKELASSLFNGNKEAESFSDPKPEIATPGTFAQDGTVATPGQPQLDGKAELEIAGNGETEAQ